MRKTLQDHGTPVWTQSRPSRAIDFLRTEALSESIVHYHRRYFLRCTIFVGGRDNELCFGQQAAGPLDEQSLALGLP